MIQSTDSIKEKACSWRKTRQRIIVHSRLKAFVAELGKRSARTEPRS